MRFKRMKICLLDAVLELNGEMTLTILVGLALVFYQSIYSSSQRIEMLEGSTMNSCSREPHPPWISWSRKVG